MADVIKYSIEIDGKINKELKDELAEISGLSIGRKKLSIEIEPYVKGKTVKDLLNQIQNLNPELAVQVEFKYNEKMIEIAQQQLDNLISKTGKADLTDVLGLEEAQKKYTDLINKFKELSKQKKALEDNSKNESTKSLIKRASAYNKISGAVSYSAEEYEKTAIELNNLYNGLKTALKGSNKELYEGINTMTEVLDVVKTIDKYKVDPVKIDTSDDLKEINALKTAIEQLQSRNESIRKKYGDAIGIWNPENVTTNKSTPVSNESPISQKDIQSSKKAINDIDKLDAGVKNIINNVKTLGSTQIDVEVSEKTKKGFKSLKDAIDRLQSRLINEPPQINIEVSENTKKSFKSLKDAIDRLQSRMTNLNQFLNNSQIDLSKQSNIKIILAQLVQISRAIETLNGENSDFEWVNSLNNIDVDGITRTGIAINDLVDALNSKNLNKDAKEILSYLDGITSKSSELTKLVYILSQSNKKIQEAGKATGFESEAKAKSQISIDKARAKIANDRTKSEMAISNLISEQISNEKQAQALEAQTIGLSKRSKAYKDLNKQAEEFRKKNKDIDNILSGKIKSGVSISGTLGKQVERYNQLKENGVVNFSNAKAKYDQDRLNQKNKTKELKAQNDEKYILSKYDDLRKNLVAIVALRKNIIDFKNAGYVDNASKQKELKLEQDLIDLQNRSSQLQDEINDDLKTGYITTEKITKAAEDYNDALLKSQIDITSYEAKHNASGVKEADLLREKMNYIKEYYDLKLEDAKLDEQTLKGQMRKKVIQQQLLDLERQINSISLSSKAQTTYKDYENDIAQKYKNNLQNFEIDTRDSALNKLDKFQSDLNDLLMSDKYTDEFNRNIDQVIQRINNLQSVVGTINLKDLKSEFRSIATEVDGLNKSKGLSEMKKVSEKQLMSLRLSMERFINRNSKMGKEFDKQWNDIRASIRSASNLNDFDKIDAAIIKLKGDIEQAGKTGRSFFDLFKSRVKGLSANFLARYFSVEDIVRYSQVALDTVKEIDYALVDLRKTTTMSATDLNKFYYDANDVAKQMGITTAQVVDLASSFSRLGYSSKEAATGMAQLAGEFALISPGMDTEVAQTGLVSIQKAFDVADKDLKREILDNINIIGNNFATSNDEIVAGLERSASAMSVANNSLEETIALFASGQEITQDAEKMGTALRTISMRIRGYDEETEELSDDLTMITGKVADLTRTADNPRGVTLFEPGDPNTYRSTYDILRDISKIWDDLTDKNQAKLLELLFGKTRANQGAAILTNFEQAEKAMDTMKDAAGSADREMQISFDSIQYHLNELQQTWVGIAQKLMDRGTINDFIDALTSISEVLGTIASSKESLAGTAGALAGIVASVKGYNASSLVQGLFNGNVSSNKFVTSNDLELFRLFTQTVEGQADVFDEATLASKNYQAMLSQLSPQARSIAETTNKAGVSVNAFGEALKAATLSEKAMAVATNLLNGALNAFVGIVAALAVSFAIKAIDDFIHREERMAEAAKDARDRIAELNSELSSKEAVVSKLSSRYAELAQEVDGLGTAFQSQGTLSNDEYKEFLDISNQLADAFPTLKTGVTETDDAILNLTGSVDTITSSLENLLSVEKKLANQKILENADAILEESNKKIAKSKSDLQRNKESQLLADNLLAALNGSGKIKDFKNDAAWQDFVAKLNKSNFGKRFDQLAIQLKPDNTLDLTGLDEKDRNGLIEYLNDYSNQLIDEVDDLNSAKKSAEKEISDLLTTYVQTDYDYLNSEKLNDNTRAVIRQIASNVTTEMFPDEVDPNVASQVTDWFNDNVIDTIASCEPEMQTAFVSLLDGSITESDIDTYWSQIRETFENPDDPIRMYFQSVIDGKRSSDRNVFDHLGGQVVTQNAAYDFNENQQVRQYVSNLTDDQKTFLLKAEFDKQTFANAKEFIDWIEEQLTQAIGDSAKKAEATVAQTVKDYNVDVTPWINGLGDAYLKIFEEGKFSKKSMKNVDDALLESIRAQFELIESTDRENGGLGIDLDDAVLNDFLKTLSNVNSTQKEVQQGFDDYATMVFNAVGGMKDFNAETANTLKRMMSESGISNADDIVDGYTVASETVDKFTIELDNATAATRSANAQSIQMIQSRLNEANATDECRMAAFHYAYEQQRAAMVNLNVEGKVAALKTIASAYLTAAQSAELFNNAQSTAGITSMKERRDKAVKAGLSGTAIAEMNKAIENKERSNDYWDILEQSLEDQVKLKFDDYKKMGSGGSSHGGGGGHQEKEKEKFKENVDWIQRTIDIIERKITNLGKIASAQFLTWGQRLGVIPDQFSAITREMDVQTAAAQAYQREADAIGLSQEYINKLKNGELDIEEITDKDLHEKIKNYQEWQDKVEECTDKIQDLKADLANLAQEKLDKLMAQFEFITQQIEHANRQAEFTRNTGNWASGYAAINNQIENTYSNIANLQQQLATAQNMLNEAAKYGVEQGSEQWQNMVNNVNSIQEALLEAQEAIQDLAKAKFDRLVTKFERMAQVIDHTTSRIQALQQEAESVGYSAAVGYITRQYDDEQKRLEALREEQKKLQENMVKAVRKGQIKRNSDVWYDMLDQIEGVKDAIWESTAALADFEDQLRELDWSRFDYLEERYSAIKDDSDFLIDLIEKEKDLYEDNGNFTDYATTSQGLHVNNLQLLQKQNKDYLNELSELNNKLVDDPNNRKLLDRRQELIQQQHDIIDGITEERQAIKELAEDGYKTFLDYLQDIIDKRKEAMNAEREAYEYSRSINEKTKNITNFQKQIAALGGGNDQSEETRLRLQQLNNDLIKAQEDLQDAEYDKWKSDQEEMLDNMYTDFENLINLKLEDLDGLVKEAKDETANAASTISQTIHGVVSEYGVALTDSQYGMRPLNETLSDIAHDVHEMMVEVDERAEDGDIVGDFFVKRKFSDKKKSKLKTTVADVDTAKNSAILKAVQSKLKYNDFDWSTSALAYYYSALGFTDTYKNDAFHNRLLYNELEKLGYSKGGTIGGLIKRTGEDGFVLAQTGEEILSLDKIKEMQNVFTAMQPLANLAKAGNLNSVVEGATKQNIGGNTMNVGTIKFDLPNVQNYSDFVAQAKADPKFEKLIQQMTFGNAMGQNPLKKYTI